jgi:hypothetical protein
MQSVPGNGKILGQVALLSIGQGDLTFKSPTVYSPRSWLIHALVLKVVDCGFE